MIRLASAIWHAGMNDGTGMISTESGALKETPFSFNPNFTSQPVTNPEELIAAAYASSYSLALSIELDKVGLIPANMRTAAGLMIEQTESGWVINQIHLEVAAQFLKGDLDKFEIAARAAKVNCTISTLLNAKITMDAKLEIWQSFGKIERKSNAIPLGRRLVAISLQEK